MIFLFVCLFVCPELIEELAGATHLKFGMYVKHVVSRNKTKDLSDISTNFWERWQNILAYQIWGFQSNCVGFQLVLLLPTDWVT